MGADFVGVDFGGRIPFLSLESNTNLLCIVTCKTVQLNPHIEVCNCVNIFLIELIALLCYQ